MPKIRDAIAQSAINHLKEGALERLCRFGLSDEEARALWRSVTFEYDTDQSVLASMSLDGRVLSLSHQTLLLAYDAQTELLVHELLHLHPSRRRAVPAAT